MKLQDALAEFQVQLCADGRSPHTRKQYHRHVAALITWLTAADRSTDVGDVTPSIVADFFASDAARLSARGGAKRATSANAQRTSLRCFFRWTHESEITTTNAARLLKRARCTPPPPRSLHPDEQQRLLAVLDVAAGPEADRDRMMIEFLLGTGVRIGSALALDVEDMDFVHREVAMRTTKNDQPSIVVMPKTIGAKLRRWLEDRPCGPVFLARSRRISVRHAQRRIAGWLARVGIAGRSAHSRSPDTALAPDDRFRARIPTRSGSPYCSTRSIRVPPAEKPVTTFAALIRLQAA